jgi:HPt (histidine-containing phosphotransfer) domain-containing protein
MKPKMMNENLLLELIELGREVDQALAQELIEKFKLDFPLHLQSLRTQALQQDFAQLQRTAHILNGSAAVLGAELVSALCREIESQAAGQVPVSAQQIIAVREAIHEALTCIDAFMNENGQVAA